MIKLVTIIFIILDSIIKEPENQLNNIELLTGHLDEYLKIANENVIFILYIYIYIYRQQKEWKQQAKFGVSLTPKSQK